MLMTTRLLCMVSMLGMAAYMLPAVFALLQGRPRYGDPARAVCFGFALLIFAFCLRWFLAPNSDELFAALYVFGSIWAVFTILAAKSYGRGPTS